MQWLQQAQEAGSIRRWWCRKGQLIVYYSSRSNVCQQERIRDWGVSADIPLIDAAQRLRIFCTQLEVQSLQERSRFAASKSLRGNQRRLLKVYRPDELLELVGGIGATGQTTSCKAPTPGIIHCGQSKIFVGARFIPFGGSQATSASALGCCIKTVQRHLADIPRRQLVQTKQVYSLAAALVEHEGTYARNESGEVHAATDGKLMIMSYPPGAASRARPYQTTRREQLFSSAGKSWRLLPNIYLLNHRLTSAKFAKRRLEKLISKPALEAVRGGPVGDKSILYSGENPEVAAATRQAE